MHRKIITTLGLALLLALPAAYADPYDSEPNSGTVSGTDAIVDQDNPPPSKSNDNSNNIGNDGETMGSED